MNAWDDYWFGPSAAARSYLLLRGFLLLLGFDCFVDLIGHGGRYGIGDFNVAHFGWLDAVQPVPSAGLYVALVSLCGLLCIASALAGVNRWVLGTLAVLYTYGWAMSMLDSYQHHYLLSIVLFAFVFFPAVNGAHLLPKPAPRKKTTKKKTTKKKTTKKKTTKKKTTKKKTASKAETPGEEATPEPVYAGHSWAYHLVAVSFAVVYAYTALSKSEAQWRSGEALQRIAPGKLDFLQELFVSDLGFADDSFWGTVGLSVIVLQVVVSSAYALSPLRDRGLPWVDYLCWIGFVAATSFHLMAELVLELQIGWFSWYMLIAAFVFFLPGRAVHVVAEVISIPGRALADYFSEPGPVEGSKPGRGPAVGLVAMSVASGAVAGLAGWAVDLPGTQQAGIAAGGALVGAAIFAVVRKVPTQIIPWIGATAIAGVLMWSSVAASEVRFDYYRKLGGVHRRHGNCELALDAYIKANEYAPAGEDRSQREEEMRRCVERREGRGPGVPDMHGGHGH